MSIFAESLRELRRLRSVVLAGLLLALQIVVDLTIGIYITPEMKIAFGFVFLAVSGALFGPSVAALQGAVADLYVALFFPKGAYFPGYTFSAALGGMLYGLFFYKRGINWRRALCAKGLVNLVINIGLNTLWLSLTGGKAMAVLLPARILKNAVLLPIEVLVLVLIGRALRSLPARLREGR